VAGLAGMEWDQAVNCSWLLGHLAEADWFAMIPFAAIMYLLYRVGTKEKNNKV